MFFKRIEPSSALAHLVECFWVVESSEPPHPQKIIPDGFPEIIFHYRDHYRINISGRWEDQTKYLMAGQITKYFHLENTGDAGMIGIKLKPSAPTQLFQLDMKEYRDKVVDLELAAPNTFKWFIDLINDSPDHAEWIKVLEKLLLELPIAQINNTLVAALDLIFDNKGVIKVGEICNLLDVNERTLERLFARYVGLSPKFYARIIRFNAIFDLMQKKDPGWSDLVYESGYYDQSHFIRNFRNFTGIDPSKYFYDEPSMANFFLRKGN